MLSLETAKITTLQHKMVKFHIELQEFFSRQKEMKNKKLTYVFFMSSNQIVST
jgi:hypothetical protein